MNVSINKENDKILCQITGRIGTAESPLFQQQIEPLMIDDNPHVEIDCSELSYISSSGLRILFTLQKSVTERNGSLVLTHMQPEVFNVFRITGFSNIIKIQ